MSPDEAAGRLVVACAGDEVRAREALTVAFLALEIQTRAEDHRLRWDQYGTSCQVRWSEALPDLTGAGRKRVYASLDARLDGIWERRGAWYEITQAGLIRDLKMSGVEVEA